MAGRGITRFYVRTSQLHAISPSEQEARGIESRLRALLPASSDSPLRKLFSQGNAG
jgi:hypothetical protein